MFRVFFKHLWKQEGNQYLLATHPGILAISSKNTPPQFNSNGLYSFIHCNIFFRCNYFTSSFHPCLFNPLCYIRYYPNLQSICQKYLLSSFRILGNKLTSPNKLSALSSQFCLLSCLLASLFLLLLSPFSHTWRSKTAAEHLFRFGNTYIIFNTTTF